MCVLACTSLVRAQTTIPAATTDVGITFTGVRSLQVGTGNSFWMEGGSAEAGVNLRRGFGLAANFTGEHTGSIAATGLPLNLIVFSAGPRYRWHAGHPLSVYGEALFGFAHGSDSAFPTSTGTEASANSFALQAGAGVDYRVTGHLAVRALDIGWLRTQLPNGADNVQNHLRIGAGVVLLLGGK